MSRHVKHELQSLLQLTTATIHETTACIIHQCHNRQVQNVQAPQSEERVCILAWMLTAEASTSTPEPDCSPACIQVDLHTTAPLPLCNIKLKTHTKID